ncbi:IS3 family transposase [Corallococcus praedator]|uniref:IS3 family transposase n=1 Tax=Corallococcus praedator TaxID=2316724 RepID=A0ABX9QCV8_9BACT|nr:IS3 family transposase [Corallococcus sp. CA047B]RKH28560.1 IS3 family transposase [Corallococcus sp. CA031C]RKI02455.1 IS3 family transposase [Corallococcus praedator]
MLEEGKSRAQVAKDLDLTRSALETWVRQARADAGQGPPGVLTRGEKEELTQLRREVHQLRMEREVFGGLLRQGEHVRFAAIQEEKAHYPVALLCRVLEVSRAGYYAWEGREASARQKANAALAEQIRRVHQDSRRTYGSPRVRAELKAQGQHVGRHRVARLMREAGLRARRRRRFVHTTDSKHGLPVAPNVLARDFNPPKSNQAWVTDITYVPTREGWVYLAVVLDLFSRRIIGWAMDHCIDRHLVLSALDMALKGRCPPAGLLHPSDRGSQGGFNGSSQHSKLRSCDGCEESSTGCPSWTPSHVIARPSIRRAAALLARLRQPRRVREGCLTGAAGCLTHLSTDPGKAHLGCQ